MRIEELTFECDICGDLSNLCPRSCYVDGCDGRIEIKRPTTVQEPEQHVSNSAGHGITVGLAERTTGLDIGDASRAMRDGKVVAPGNGHGIMYRITEGDILEVFGFSASVGCRIWYTTTLIDWQFIRRTDWRIVPEKGS